MTKYFASAISDNKEVVHNTNISLAQHNTKWTFSINRAERYREIQY